MWHRHRWDRCWEDQEDIRLHQIVRKFKDFYFLVDPDPDIQSFHCSSVRLHYSSYNASLHCSRVSLCGSVASVSHLCGSRFSHECGSGSVFHFDAVTDKLVRKWTSIASVPDLCLSAVNIFTHLVSHISLNFDFLFSKGRTGPRSIIGSIPQL